MITEEAHPFHPPPFSYRILYAGNDHRLSEFLRQRLEDCYVTRSPIGSVAHLLIKGVNYSLLLFDEMLPDKTGAELESFTRRLPQREDMPVIIIKDGDTFDGLAQAITCSLRPLNKFKDWWVIKRSCCDGCCAA
ncbi:MAG TPA: hypothetical protein VGO69_05020 [Pyrinomonadaceae bacterium]|nr:hypothetical protein [Pyrinomonadaceae bacterium]